jgi:hypothetical protein
MTRRPTRIGAISTVLMLLASIAVSLAIFPGTAQAICAGQNKETYDSLKISGAEWMNEYAVADTCNGNSYYQGYFRSTVLGWRASIHIQNNGVWESRYGVYDSTSFVYYWYTDNNSHSAITLCVDDGTVWFCGWGDKADATFGVSHKYTSTNTGF